MSSGKWRPFCLTLNELIRYIPWYSITGLLLLKGSIMTIQNTPSKIHAQTFNNINSFSNQNKVTGTGEKAEWSSILQ